MSVKLFKGSAVNTHTPFHKFQKCLKYFKLAHGGQARAGAMTRSSLISPPEPWWPLVPCQSQALQPNLLYPSPLREKGEICEPPSVPSPLLTSSLHLPLPTTSHPRRGRKKGRGDSRAADCCSLLQHPLAGTRGGCSIFKCSSQGRTGDARSS